MISRRGHADPAQQRMGASRQRSDTGSGVPRTKKAAQGGGGWLDTCLGPRRRYLRRGGGNRGSPPGEGRPAGGGRPPREPLPRQTESAIYPRPAADRREARDELQQLLRVRGAEGDRVR